MNTNDISMSERNEDYKILSLKDMKFALNPFNVAKLPGEKKKVKCEKCGENGLYFCRSCFSNLLDAESVKLLTEKKPLLPVPLGVIHFAGESINKSSVPGVLSICPDIKLIEVATVTNASTKKTDENFKEIKDDLERYAERMKLKQSSFDAIIKEAIDINSSVLLMPSDDAVDVKDIDWEKISRAYVIDCTWNQTNIVSASEIIKNMKKVKIQGRSTIFWRQHMQSFKGCLSSAESIYYLCKDISDYIDGKNSKNLEEKNNKIKERNLDNLLFFFVVQYIVVQKSLNFKQIHELTRKKPTQYSSNFCISINDLEKEFEKIYK